MKLEFTSTLKKENVGIAELLKFLGKKSKLSFDFKKGKVTIENFSNDKIEDILSIIQNNFDILTLEVNNEKKYKIRNDEKDIQAKKKNIKSNISKKPSTIMSQVQAYILKEKVFTLTMLRETFPNTNFATLRAYVNDLKQENILIELERGKYAVR